MTVETLTGVPCRKCGGTDWRSLRMRWKQDGPLVQRWRCTNCRSHVSDEVVHGRQPSGRRLTRERRAEIVSLLMDGMSMAAVCRVAQVAPKTVFRLRQALGSACRDVHQLWIRDLHPAVIQSDECWTRMPLGPHRKSEDGHTDRCAWVWCAIDQRSRLLISWHVGRRNQESAFVFLSDLKGRCPGNFDLITDGCFMYPRVVEDVFTETGVHHVVLNTNVARAMRFSSQAHRKDGHTTNHVERLNGDLRTRLAVMRRSTHATARSFAGLRDALAIYSVHYNFVRVQRGLGGTPAMAMGIEDKPWQVMRLVELVEAHEQPIARQSRWDESRRERQSETWAKKSETGRRYRNPVVRKAAVPA